MPSEFSAVTTPTFRFSWRAALIGGFVAVGAGAFFGTLITNVSLWLTMAKGVPLDEAYASISLSITSPTELLSLISQALSGFFGGYVAVKYGNGRWFVQAPVAGGVLLLFVLVMYASPVSQAGQVWYIAITTIVPFVACIIGGYVGRSRT
jgi:hypothetical protein